MQSRFCGHLRLAIGAVLIPLLVPAGAQAQSVEEFYRGKTISMVIGYPAAGANDRYARTVARLTVAPGLADVGGSLRCR